MANRGKDEWDEVDDDDDKASGDEYGAEDNEAEIPESPKPGSRDDSRSAKSPRKLSGRKIRKENPFRRLQENDPESIASMTNLLKDLLFMMSRKEVVNREVLEHYFCEQVAISCNLVLLMGTKCSLDSETLDGLCENLLRLHFRIMKLSSQVAVKVTKFLETFVRAVAGVSANLEMQSSHKAVDWDALSINLMEKIRGFTEVHYNYLDFIPKLHLFRAVNRLEEGSFSQSFFGKIVATDTPVVIKHIPLSHLHSLQHRAAESMLSAVCKNHFLSKMFCCFSTESAHVAVFRHIPSFNLNVVLRTYPQLKSVQIRTLASQLYLAIEYIHLKGFIHQDIKAANVLVTSRGHVHLKDFDSSRLCLSHYVKARSLKMYFKRTARELTSHESLGSLCYRAPEVIRKTSYGRAIDWWAYGCVLFKMLARRLPFNGPTERLKFRILRMSLNWDIAKWPYDFPTKELVNGLLVKSPRNRLGSRTTYRELRSHDFFKEVDFVALSSSRGSSTLVNLSLLDKLDCSQILNVPELMTPTPDQNEGHEDFTDLERQKELRRNDHKCLFTYTTPKFRRLLQHIDRSNGASSTPKFFTEASSKSSEHTFLIKGRGSSDLSMDVHRLSPTALTPKVYRNEYYKRRTVELSGSDPTNPPKAVKANQEMAPRSRSVKSNVRNTK